MLKPITALALGLITSLASISANASLIATTYSSGSATPSTINGYAMTDFGLVAGSNGDAISSISSPISGSVGLSDQYGNDVYLGSANSASWWVNGEASDYSIFTTSTHQITITLPANTLAFSFNVGANVGASAWFHAYETGNSTAALYSGVFGVSGTNTPGFGISADNSNSTGECSYLSSIVVDPSFIWGVGNFSINQGSCTSVPEPSSIALLAIGLMGLGFIRRGR